MIDIDPPAHTPHTWRDFFIHIATIVLGLVIAIGLEQSVEHFHQHHQVREARDALLAEHRQNIRIFHDNMRNHVMAEANLHDNLLVFQYLLAHPHSAPGQWPFPVLWPVGTSQPMAAAWATAKQTGVLELIPGQQVAGYTKEYAALDQAWQAYQDAIPLQARCVDYLFKTSDPSTLSAGEIAQEITEIQARLSTESYYGLKLYQVGQEQKDYGPTPGLWQVDPFMYMQDEIDREAAVPGLRARADRDIQTALSMLQQTSAPPSQ